MGIGASSWIPEDFQIDTSLAFQGNFSIAKAQRAVLGSSRLRSLVYAAFVLSAKFCALRDTEGLNLLFFACFAIPFRALRLRAFKAFDRKVREGFAKFAKDEQGSVTQ